MRFRRKTTFTPPPAGAPPVSGSLVVQSPDNAPVVHAPEQQPDPPPPLPPVPEPPDASPAGEAAAASRGDSGDLPTDAPTIGRVGPLPRAVLSVDCPIRPPAVALDGATAGDLHVAAASIIGGGHLHDGQPRQDSYDLMVGRSGRLYVAVADGLGSRPTSQLGARLFTESVLVAATEAESDATSPPTAVDLLTRACTRMHNLLTGVYTTDPRDAACVGAVAVVTNGRCQIARVGDVAAFTLSDDVFTEVFAVESGFVNVVTATLPDADSKHVETVDLAPVPVIVLGTDGVAGDLRHSAALRTWLAQRWRAPLQPFAMGDTLRYRRQGSHDDRTAVVIWGPAPPEPDGAASGADAVAGAAPPSRDPGHGG